MKSLRLDTGSLSVHGVRCKTASPESPPPPLSLHSVACRFTHQVSQKLWWPPVLCQTQEPRPRNTVSEAGRQAYTGFGRELESLHSRGNPQQRHWLCLLSWKDQSELTTASPCPLPTLLPTALTPAKKEDLN